MFQDRVSLQGSLESARPPRFVCMRTLHAGASRVVVDGELDVATAPQLDRVLRKAEADTSLVLLDLHGLEFLAGCGVKLLLEADARIRRSGGRLSILDAPPALGRILALTGAGSALDIERDPSAGERSAVSDRCLL